MDSHIYTLGPRWEGGEEEQGHELALAGRAENDTFLVLRGWCREHGGSLVLQVA